MPLGLLLASCVVVPFAWGIAVAWWLSRRDAARARFVPPEQPGSDYSI